MLHEAMLVSIGEQNIAALCCNLAEPPDENESNPEYEQKLAATMKKAGCTAATNLTQ